MNLEPRFRALAWAALTTVSLPTLALAQTLTVNDINYEGENGFKVAIPTIEATGTNLDEAAIRNLFGGGLEAAAKTLSTLDAERISIPTLTVSTTAAIPGGEPTTTTYYDLELSGVSDGIATSATLGSAEVTGTSDTTVQIGEMPAGLLDLGAIAGFYGYAEPSEELKPVYSNFSIAGMEFAGPGFTCAIGETRADEFSARPLKGTLEEMMKWTAELEAAEKDGTTPSPEVLKAAILYYVDLLTAFQSSPTVVDGLNCSGEDDDKNAVTVTAGPLNIGGFNPGIYPEVSLDGLKIDVANDGWMEFGGFLWKDMNLTGPIDVIRANADNLTPDWFESNWRQLIPALAGFTIRGFAMDIPSEEPGSPRIQAKIGGLDLSLANYVNGIPADMVSSGSDISVTMPPESRPILSALGIDELVMGYGLAARWDQQTSTIVIDNVALTGQQLGGITMTGTIGNAGAQLFDSDPDVALAASMSMTVKDLTVSLDNQGFVPALIAFAALEQGQAPEALHVGFTGMAQALPLALLGATADAQSLSTALGAFFQGAPNLTIKLTAVDPNGIGLPELMAAQENPALLKGKVTITASADGPPLPFTFPDLSSLPAPEAPAATPSPAPESEADSSPMIAPPAPAATEAPTRAEDKASNKQ